MPLTMGIESKDQYGNKIGKIHDEAVFKFTGSKWSVDARTTLRTLLKIEIGRKAFLKFLSIEYAKVELDCYLEFQVQYTLLSHTLPHSFCLSLSIILPHSLSHTQSSTHTLSLLCSLSSSLTLSLCFSDTHRLTQYL